MKLSTVLARNIAANSSAFVPKKHVAGRALASLSMANVKSLAEMKNFSKYAGKVTGAYGTMSFSSAVEKDNVTMKQIDKFFGGAMKSKDLVNSVASSLKKHGFTTDNTMIATSFCVDELSRVNENDFAEVFGPTFNLGGLAGLPYAGLTGFGAMAAHIPDGGNCVVVYAPHVGIDSNGNVGTVERVGCKTGGDTCGAAVAASNYVTGVLAGSIEKRNPPGENEPLDACQFFLGDILLHQAARLEKAPERMVELPFVVYDAQKELVDKIVMAGCGNVKEGKIAVLGGIQINTPPGLSDFFLPLSFEVVDNKGNKLEDMMSAL